MYEDNSHLSNLGFYKTSPNLEVGLPRVRFLGDGIRFENACHLDIQSLQPALKQVSSLHLKPT